MSLACQVFPLIFTSLRMQVDFLLLLEQPLRCASEAQIALMQTTLSYGRITTFAGRLTCPSRVVLREDSEPEFLPKD